MKKKTLVILTVAIVLCLFTVISTSLVTTIRADEQKEIDLIEDVISRAEIVTMKASSIQDETGRMPCQLSEEEKQSLIDNYINDLETLYCPSASQLYTYAEVRRQLMNSDDQFYDRVYEHGVFEVELNNVDISGDTASVNATVYSWQKYIPCSEENGYTVVFPVTRTTCVYEMKNTNGNWMITSQTELDYVFDGDSSLIRNFDSFEEAVEYADSITVKNTLK